jgi:alkylation response protein AidB-like acyl-CoA dehydrogenase
MPYRPPVAALLFSLTEVAGLPLGGDLDRETAEAILEAAGALAADTLAPLNRTGDLEGARLENGQVRTPAGFADAYRAFVEGGWPSLSGDPAYGGQGLPKALDCAVFEMISAANLAFGLCPLLAVGAAEALASHADERLKALYLPKLTSGEWTATMQLTEPQAGSDLGALAARAEPDGEGGWRLFGQKIFITWGDHDLADNIVHMVLARLPDAPAGSHGISLFVTVKRRVEADGALGPAEPVRPVGLEHKLGIHASPTCVMALEGARADLVGRPHEGLAHMFTMMNAARLNVGVQGVGVAERAYQQALAYALERRQGRSAWTGAYPSRIFDHPDVRRMLALTRAKIEAARALCLSTAVSADLARSAEDAGTRRQARLREEVLTPVAKAWSSDMGVEAASTGIQVHGGMGFIEETGAAQVYRDGRIPPIYEGTNGIQAIDLAGRKLGLEDGEGFRNLVGEMRAITAEAEAAPGLEPVAARLRTGIEALEGAAAWMGERRGDPDSLAGAAAFLKLTGDVVGASFLAKGALAAARSGDARFAADRAALARLFAGQVLTGAPGLAEAVAQGAGELAALDEAALTA